MLPQESALLPLQGSFRKPHSNALRSIELQTIVFISNVYGLRPFIVLCSPELTEQPGPMTSLSNNASSPSAPQSQLVNTRPPPGRGGSIAGFRRGGMPANSLRSAGAAMNGWVRVPAVLLQMVDHWDTACYQAATATLLPVDRQYWQERLLAFRQVCHCLEARYSNGISGSFSDAAHGSNGWAYAPLELVDMLEELDTACVLAAAAEQAADQRHSWEERIETQRSARVLLDSATPSHSVPLVPR
ncbi:Uncharacterised protein [Achromobacter aegrifaciens]|uniref:Uncharacterized protein n=2 Tax=Alcaligenaceae TaxID=506 RepID=A0AAD2KLY0_ACHAE|nr:Uncharacterised protein [Achromobacter aegrifaciens]